MGWVWKDDEESNNSTSLDNINPNPNSNSVDYCTTRKIVQSNCKTVEIEPGKFVRKCEKTEQILRDCAGKPTEIIQSTKEYTEDEVTNEMKTGSPSFWGSSDKGPFDMPGLRNDLEDIERSIFGGLNSFFEAANEMRNGFFRKLDDPSLFGGNSSSPSRKRGIPIDDPVKDDSKTESMSSNSGSVDLSGLARDV